MAQRRAKAHQATFSTPLADLDRFVDTVLSAMPIASASLAVDEVVFEPKYGLMKLGHQYKFELPWTARGLVVEAENAQEVQELLCAALSEWIDFCFVPAEGRFMIYADHDEFITFFADKEPQLDRLVRALKAARFKPVDYHRVI